MAAKAAADDLFAQKLRAESPKAEDMGHGVGVPAFGQHRYRDDTANLLAEPARASDRVHHLAQQFALARFALRAAGAVAGGTLPLELFDLRAGGVAKTLVERVAGFDLSGVDQQRARA